jgi:hypothetical protein
MATSREHDNEPLGFIQGVKFLGWIVRKKYVHIFIYLGCSQNNDFEVCFVVFIKLPEL